MNCTSSYSEKYVEKLAKEFNAPSDPGCTVDNNIKADVEKRLGVNLPGDYYDYINSFGYGSFSYSVKVANFFRKNGVEEYFQEIDDNREIMDDQRSMRNAFGLGDSVIYVENGEIVSKDKNNTEDGSLSDYDELESASIDAFEDEIKDKIIRFGIGFPYDYFDNGRGLLYFGNTDDCNFFWNIDSDKCTVVAYMDVSFCEFDMTFSEFLYHFLHGKIAAFANPGNTYVYKEYEE